jgi:hypothetical protein
MRLIRPALVIAAIAALLPLSPASAVGTFGSSHRIDAANCSGLVSAVGSDGKTRGFESCSAGLRYVEGFGAHWTSSPANFQGTVLAVAVSGTTTYFLLEAGGIFVKSRSATGSLSPARKLSSGRSAGAALAVYGSQWWAVWGEGNGNSGFNLFEAHTLLGTGATRRAYGSPTSQVEDAYPTIAYQPATKTALIAWSHGRSAGSLTAVRTNSKGGAWGAVSALDSAGEGVVAAISGGTVVLADVHGTSRGPVVGVYVGGVTGSMSFHALSRTAATPVGVSISGGRIDVVYNYYTSTGRAAGVGERNGGVWTEATFTSPSQAVAVATQSYGGRARVFFALPYGGIAARSQ